eukprot:7959765-Pyramimonas_sp.AAC.1
MADWFRASVVINGGWRHRECASTLKHGASRIRERTSQAFSEGSWPRAHGRILRKRRGGLELFFEDHP